MRKRERHTLKDKKDGVKILLINPFGIGDVIFSTPLIGMLKESIPSSSLYYICNKRACDVIEKCPYLDGIYVFEKGYYRELWKKEKLSCLRGLISFANKIKKERFDIAIDMSMGHQYGLFLKLINVPDRIGFDYKGRARFHTKRLGFNGFNDKPIGEYYKDLLTLSTAGAVTAAGSSAYPTRIWWDKSEEDYVDYFFREGGIPAGKPVIGIAPGGGASFGEKKIDFKRWPAHKFAQLASMLMKDAANDVILIWGPGEEGLADKIAGLMDVKPVIAPGTSVREMAALMSRCDCVVCNDSGPLHVAVAAGARTVSVFGPSDHNVYGPYPKSGGHIVVTGDIGCRPCYKKFKLPDCETIDCLDKVEAKDVSAAVMRLIKPHTPRR